MSCQPGTVQPAGWSNGGTAAPGVQGSWVLEPWGTWRFIPWQYQQTATVPIPAHGGSRTP